MKHPVSVKGRLLRTLSVGLCLLWLITALLSAVAVSREINEAGDKQMRILAENLLKSTQIPSAGMKLQTVLIPGDGEMGFAVRQKNGVLLTGNDSSIGKAAAITASEGFTDYGRWWKKDGYRVLRLTDPATGITAAVAVSRGERLQTVMGAVWVQLALSVLSLPALLLLIYFGVSRGMRPIHDLATDLSARNADNLEPLPEKVPKELQPLVDALNSLFIRVDEAVEREKRFTADAAHELRSPLAALKVQMEVLDGFSTDEGQKHRMQLIRDNLDRIISLANQLLLLSELDPMTKLPGSKRIDWEAVSNAALQTVNYAAREKKMRLQRDSGAAVWRDILPMCGDAVLLEALLRNLLDNAVRYGRAESRILLSASPESITVENCGFGVDEAYLPRLQERFFRPPGHKEAGNGLGLSIAARIAQLHGLVITAENIKNPDGSVSGFRVSVTAQHKGG